MRQTKKSKNAVNRWGNGNSRTCVNLLLRAQNMLKNKFIISCLLFLLVISLVSCDELLYEEKCNYI